MLSFPSAVQIYLCKEPTDMPKRKKLPEELERDIREYDLDDSGKVCDCCGERLERIGSETSEQLDFIPARVFVVRHVRFKYACKHCEQKVVTADKDRQPIEKGLPAAGLLAHVVISKYLDHQPLYRLEGIFSRHDIDINRSTMCGWAGSCADLLEPLYKRMAQEVLESKVINTDDPARKVIELLCWAHARRYFYDARKTAPQLSHTALAWIKMLYQIEKEIKDLSAEQKKVVRQEKSVVILNDFKNWLDEIPLEQALPQSPIRQAINYALNGWEALCRYTADGEFSIDNNIAENLMRPIALGRKNWLFFGSDNGGRTAAILFTINQSAKRHGLNVFNYLKDIIARISDHPANQLHQLLPDKWSPS